MSDISEKTVAQLNVLVRAKTGDSGAHAHSLETLPGHAGFSYSFILDRSDGGAPSGKMVVRMSAPNVRISGPADIERQARIMASFASTPVPVPPIYWHGAEEEFFGRPYMIAGFVEPSFKLSESTLPMDHIKRLARLGMGTMAALHAMPWEPRRSAFGDPFALSEEFVRLDYLLDRPTLDARDVGRAFELRDRLRSSVPTGARIGCVHGDFQWANLLFDEEKPVALIDWEISSIGPTLLDLGWISFFADSKSFVDEDPVRGSIMNPDELFDAYAAAATFPVSAEEVRWFRAFAGYRFGVITCFNVMLHRRGKRDDPHWLDIAKSAPTMFEHGLEVLG